MTGNTIATLLCCATVVALATACGPVSSVTIGNTGRPAHRVESVHRGGPPPHAPAHGYRHKHHRSHGGDVELVFDSGLGVYVVVGMPNRYYWEGHYLRIDGDQWYASVDLDSSNWERCSSRDLPPGLAKKHSRANGPPGLRRGGPPAKGRW